MTTKAPSLCERVLSTTHKGRLGDPGFKWGRAVTYEAPVYARSCVYVTKGLCGCGSD